MTKSEIFTAAWIVARQTRDSHPTLRCAFAAALRATYASRKVPAFEAPVIDGCVRRGGCGASAWVARITGLDERFGFARQFLDNGANLSRSGRSGGFRWVLDRPGIYELRDVQYGKNAASIGKLDRGFIRVAADGSTTRIAKPDVAAHLA